MTAVDSSLRMIRNAQARDKKNSMKIRYVHSDAAQLDQIAEASFDLVFANMSLMDIANGENAIGEVSRVLRKGGGRFVASISHPCFDTGSNSGWVAEKPAFADRKVYRKVTSYRVPFSEKVPWRLENNERKFTRAFHRPLNWYARVLHLKGLAITALEEPEPTEEFLEKEREKRGRPRQCRVS